MENAAKSLQSYQKGYEIGYKAGWSDCNEGKGIDKEVE